MKTHIAILNAAMIASLTLAGASFVSADNDNVAKKDKYHSQKAIAAMDPDAIEGKDLLDSNGQQLGDVDELVHGSTGEQMAVIGLEDSLKEVVIPLDKLELSADGQNFVTMLTRAELEAMPDYDPMDLESVDE